MAARIAAAAVDDLQAFNMLYYDPAQMSLFSSLRYLAAVRKVAKDEGQIRRLAVEIGRVHSAQARAQDSLHRE